MVLISEFCDINGKLVGMIYRYKGTNVRLYNNTLHPLSRRVQIRIINKFLLYLSYKLAGMN